MAQIMHLFSFQKRVKELESVSHPSSPSLPSSITVKNSHIYNTQNRLFVYIFNFKRSTVRRLLVSILTYYQIGSTFCLLLPSEDLKAKHFLQPPPFSFSLCLLFVPKKVQRLNLRSLVCATIVNSSDSHQGKGRLLI